MNTPQTGKKVGSYRISEPIGGGAMGRVWRGEDEALGRPVAIKMLRTELADRASLIQRFRIEAQVLARLAHPNVAMVYALVEEGDDLYLVMEYVDGETLYAHLDRRGPLDLDSCFRIFHQALAGIQHAHEAGVVHRDIKPSNLMLDPAGQVKWIDFGIAHVRGRERMTHAGGLVGTPEYMAPEQVRGEPGTIRSDVYSLGVVLFKILTGRAPFTGKGEFDVMRAQVEDPPPRPSEHGTHIGRRLETVLLRALAKDPAARFPSAASFQYALIEAGAPEPRGGRAIDTSGIASEITLIDDGAPRPARARARARPPEPPPTRRAVLDDPDGPPATVELLPPEEPPTALLERVADRRVATARPRRSGVRPWLGVAFLAAASAAALNWVAAPDPSGEPAPSTPRALAPIPPATASSGSFASPSEGELGTSPPRREAAARPAGETRPAPVAKTDPGPEAEGWEIVR